MSIEFKLAILGPLVLLGILVIRRAYSHRPPANDKPDHESATGTPYGGVGSGPED